MKESARLVVSGSWIEGIYITANIAGTSRDNTEFLKILANQKSSLNTIVSLLGQVKDKEEAADIFKGLNDIKGVYEQVGETMTAGQLEELTVRIEALRESII